MILQLRITFYLYLYRTNSKGQAPIFCKLTWGNDRKQFSTSVFTYPNLWDKDSQRVKGADDEAVLINRKLQEIYSQLIKIEKQLYDEGVSINLDAIYDRYRGKIVEHGL